MTFHASRASTPRRLSPLALALSGLFGLGMAPQAQATDMYWVGNVSSVDWIGKPAGAQWLYVDNWKSGSNVAVLPRNGDLLHFQVNKNITQSDNMDLSPLGMVFDSGAAAFTINGLGKYLSIGASGIANKSSHLQTINAGITVATDQTWDGGSAGVYLGVVRVQTNMNLLFPKYENFGGLDLVSSKLTLANKVTLDYASQLIGADDGGEAALTVLSGSLVKLKTFATLGAGTTNGTLTVQGSDSTFQVGTDLTVGDFAKGTVDVRSGGTVIAATATLGRSTGTGSVSVSGTDARLAISGDLVATRGSVTVGAGGVVTALHASFADYAGTSAALTVQGSGARLIVSETLRLGAAGAATLDLRTGGTVQALDVNIGALGSLNLNGGTLSTVWASNQGTFNWTSGTLVFRGDAQTGAGTLLGQGTSVGHGQRLEVSELNVVAGSTLGFLGGGQGSMYLMIVDAGGELTVGAQGRLSTGGVVNNGSLLLSGGDLQGITTNNGYMSAAGSFSGGWLVNNGLLSQSGAFTISDASTSTNNGTWDLASGRGLQLFNASLINNGTMNIGGDTIGGSGALVNAASGTLAGHGTITTAFNNAGRLVVDGGQMRIVQAFSNNGSVLMNSAVAMLSGGRLTNSGRIEGQGQINNDVINNGTLQARSGTLSLTGAVSNSGVLSINRDATLLLSQGLTNNAGKIQLAGGIFDNNGNALTNAASGVISGYGDLRSGTLTNEGRVLLSGGTSAVYADVLGSNASQIILSGNSNTTFYGKVDIQSGAELRVSNGSVATFFELVEQRSGANFTGTGAKRFEGGLSVGASPGLGTDEGDVEFGESNTYLAEVGGTSACTLACGTNNVVKNSSFDKYVVMGQLSFGGTLTLTSWNGFVAQAGQHFDLFDWGSTTGTFANIDSSGFKLAAGTRLDTSALYTTGEISVTSVPEPADWALTLAGLSVLAWRARRQRSGQVVA
jgi:T5SS/PEP-CTERM-associated repeat protein